MYWLVDRDMLPSQGMFYNFCIQSGCIFSVFQQQQLALIQSKILLIFHIHILLYFCCCLLLSFVIIGIIDHLVPQNCSRFYPQGEVSSAGCVGWLVCWVKAKVLENGSDFWHEVRRYLQNTVRARFFPRNPFFLVIKAIIQLLIDLEHTNSLYFVILQFRSKGTKRHR